MDPNLNRNSMGSRAGTSLKPKFGGGGVGVGSRQGTAVKVFGDFKAGIESTWRCWEHSDGSVAADYNGRRYQWSSGCEYEPSGVRQELLHKQNKRKINGN